MVSDWQGGDISKLFPALSGKEDFLSCVFTDFLLIYLLYKFAQNYAIINGIRSINPIATQIFVTATIG